MQNLVRKLLICVLPICYGQENVPVNASFANLHVGLTEKIGNFSIELLYHTSKVQQEKNSNMIMSPITVWTTLAAISEGAAKTTLHELNRALRLRKADRATTRSELHDIAEWLKIHNKTIESYKMNTIFINSNSLPLKDFADDLKKFYKIDVYFVNFTQTEIISRLVNRIAYASTNGKLPNIVEDSYFANAHIIIASALYFKGQWKIPFNKSSTTRAPFYSSNGELIGEVDMMYSKNTYPLSNIKKLQARVIELPYGSDNRLSMFIMLPFPGVSLENMFYNFNNITLDEMYEELRVCGEVFGEDKVDCYIPRFQIDTPFELSNVMTILGLYSLLDQNKTRLPLVARTPVYVSKVLHRVKIEVTEDGIMSSNSTEEPNSNTRGAGTVKFVANRPFVFLIVEKVTNSILFGGNYQHPSVF